MHFSALVALAALVASPFALAQASDTVYVVYGNGQQFEDPTASVDTLTCGSVLAAEGYAQVGDIPGNLAGFANVTNADSPLCSQCVVLGWQGRDVTVRIVDTSSEGGFVVTEGTYEELVGSDTVLPGIYQARIVEGPYSC
ncbi:uncharacterized protein B0H18DRAFT_517951 [Fomitopsis serialis]|uniref:uncharacterized protein n=1 Tax=Fomitopsis serialis TaxID=139415 RepID=UPI002008A87E|nr:uncharacterized protein B0H18DRAFT_1125690 [Neoantrodia serialis]XP_047891302.1 uncharacterized protein B0H18DRAFT_517951 [Neoantrodia serialis]KAH9914302.1 hypothetical protein B0H18DRAFT_1125690 [Neoantrodia serialis]KAH9922376.1 hypothetical protein B0H18DRAFT_517951 [Neoantrodia serialis]